MLAHLLLVGLLTLVFSGVVDAEPAPPPPVTVQNLLGRPVVHIGGKPVPFAAYSPLRSTSGIEKSAVRFHRHKLPIYMVELPPAPASGDFFGYSFWVGNEISSNPITPGAELLDKWIAHILEREPDARFILRAWTHEPISWRKLNPDDLFVNDDGKVLQTPSLASEKFWDGSAKVCDAIIRYCESRPWADRMIGYANFLRVEGSHEPVIMGDLFDHSPVMIARWRAFLRAKYKTVEALREAYKNPALDFDSAPVPTDKMRGKTAEVSAIPYWQGVADNAPLRDYLTLSSQLFREGFTRIAEASRKAAGPGKLLLYDGLKQPMQGWSNLGFFDATHPWPLTFPDVNPGAGSMSVEPLFNLPGFDGLITPHDYQARGIGGVFEPEAPADSMVLRGKLYVCEMDTRTYTGKDPLAPARNDKEFAAISWRNLATGLSRGFNVYWMDLNEDWFGTDGIHRSIGRQVEVLKESLKWKHSTPPGIAVVLDDAAGMETNGSGNFLNEAVMWEFKMGMARCGVPFRIYLLEDLALDNFPEHRVFYFPNLFKVDDARMALLQKKVFRDGRVVVWGPGSGISDGVKVSAASASRLTGFQMDVQATNYQRRTLVTKFDHPITASLRNDAVLGGPLPYGPVLYPMDGESLGAAWAKYGKNLSGLSVKSFGKGAAGQGGAAKPFGAGDWASVFSTTVNLPADFWRGVARFAGAHVYCEDNDVLLAGGEVVALHSARPGKRTIALPRASAVTDLVKGEKVSGKTSAITFDLDGPETRVFRVVPVE